jgi:alkanesulfonate monooxygenase SsuD/methylene tetrahydromethanopterin reductase-like flavin-dependent oxidoreductase (luciferase family)
MRSRRRSAKAAGAIPLLVTGTSQQTLDWVGQHADGWLTYPEATHHAAGPQRLAGKIQAWRRMIPTGASARMSPTNGWIWSRTRTIHAPRSKAATR